MGGMGDVYEGIHEMIGKKLAIKCMHLDFAANTDAVTRFKREARAATAVGNEHIVDVSDLGDLPDGSPFMVMEYLHGRELAALIHDESPLPVPRVIAIVLEVLEALSAAHASGVVHRDMKPENIFLVERGGNKDFVKVLDFGISMISEQADAAKGRMTQTGMAMGTPNYMSPEQARGSRDVDHRTDLYSVGVILFQALTNSLPFDAQSLAVLMTKILTEPPGSIREHRGELPVALDRIVQRAMAKDADTRFEDAEEFADVLRPFLDEDYVAPEVTTSPACHATIKLKAAVEEGPSGSDNTAELPFRGEELPAQSEVVSAETFVVASTTEPNSAGGRGKWIAGALALAVAGAGAFVFSGGKDTAPTPTPERVSPPPSMAVGTPEIPEVSREVKVRITATPAGAKVYLDGKPFPSGSQVAQPRSMAPVRIQVVLAGYQAIDDVAVFDEDRELAFELKKSDIGTVTPPSKTTADSKKTKRMNRSGKANKRAAKIETKPPPTTPVGKKKIDDKKDKDSSVYTGSQGVVRDKF